MKASLKRHPSLKTAGALVAFALLLACGAPAAEGPWITLFDGTDLSAWRTYGVTGNDAPRWAIEDGALAWRPKCGYLATREVFGDFELELDWKVGPGANSGILFRVVESKEEPYRSGPEMQILDNERHKDGKKPETSAGALYALYPPAEPAARPVGEWNHIRIRAVGPKIDFWLNGRHVVAATIGSDDWRRRVAASKFAAMPHFAQSPRGAIVLQDHGKDQPVWYRAIRIRRLD